MLVIGMCIAETFGREQGDVEREAADNLCVGIPIVSLFVLFGAFANIWIEYLFKNVDTGEPFPVRNARLYVFGVAINGFVFAAEALGHERGPERAGWALAEGLQSADMWILASSNGIAGLFTAVIFNFADNIIAVLLQGAVLPLLIMLQYTWYGLRPNAALLCGAAMVTVGIVGVKTAPAPEPLRSSQDESPGELTSLVPKGELKNLVEKTT